MLFGAIFCNKTARNCQKKNPYQVRLDKGLWRNGRDSNPRAAHHGNTISSRARYDHFDTIPKCLFHQLIYYITKNAF